MPIARTWMRRIPEILERLHDTNQAWYDRSDIEDIFDLYRTAAANLMKEAAGDRLEIMRDVIGCGSRRRPRDSRKLPPAPGQDFVISRKDLLHYISGKRKTRTAREEAIRFQTFQERLETKHNEMKARAIKILAGHAVEQALEMDLPSLPPTITLTKDRLTIDFRGAEDLLRQLFELSQAIMNDYPRFQAACEEGHAAAGAVKRQ